MASLKTRCLSEFNNLVPVVQKVDDAIHRMKRYLLCKY